MSVVFAEVGEGCRCQPRIRSVNGHRPGYRRPNTNVRMTVTSVTPVPFQSFYNVPEAALNSISDTCRLEVEAFGIKVVELKTGNIRTKFGVNRDVKQSGRLPEGSLYEPAHA